MRRLRESKARVQDLVGAEQMGIAQRNLLIQNANRAVGLSIQRQWNRRKIHSHLLAVADTQKPGGVCALLIIQTKVALVGLVGEGNFLGVIVRSKAARVADSLGSWLENC